MESQYRRVDSFQEDLQIVQDEFLPQPFDDTENFQANNGMMFSPQYCEGTPLQAMEYCEEQRGLKRRHSDSANLSLGSGSSDEPEWMRQQLLEDPHQPLPNINISPADLLGPENVGHPQTEIIPPVIQPANIREDVAHWVHSTQNPLMVQMQNTMTAPQLQASNNIQQSVFSYDSATRIPEIPNAPPRHQLELSVGYQELRCLEKRVINHRDGFLLFHERTPDPTELPKECQFIKFPDPSAVGDGGVIPDKILKYIQRVLANLQGGLQIRCHEGCIYATRRSKAKIFYGTHDLHSETSELPRNHEVMIFNGIQYIKTILQKYLKQENCEEVAKWLNPTIYFTFAQKWFPDATPLKSMLVWAKIIPHEPHYFWDSFFHAKENSSHKSLTSMNSDLIKVSMDHTT